VKFFESLVGLCRHPRGGGFLLAFFLLLGCINLLMIEDIGSSRLLVPCRAVQCVSVMSSSVGGGKIWEASSRWRGEFLSVSRIGI
jgi:hypothetical protein